jgi:hypothetical protein
MRLKPETIADSAGKLFRLFRSYAQCCFLCEVKAKADKRKKKLFPPLAVLA